MSWVGLGLELPTGAARAIFTPEEPQVISRRNEATLTSSLNGVGFGEREQGAGLLFFYGNRLPREPVG